MSKSLSRKRLPLSHRARRGMVTGVLAGLAGLVLLGRLGPWGTGFPDDRRGYDNRSFTVVKVVDGDTLDLGIPDRKTGYATTRVRLWGVDTPETVHPRRGAMYWGIEAADFTRKLVLHKRVQVRLEPHQPCRDKFERLLAYIYLTDETMLNEELIRKGHGYADERFSHIMRNRFLRLQKESQDEHRGLWQAVRPEQWPEWYRKRHDPDYTLE